MKQYAIRSRLNGEYFSGKREGQTVVSDLSAAMLFDSIGDALREYAVWHRETRRMWSQMPEVVEVRETTIRTLRPYPLAP